MWALFVCGVIYWKGFGASLSEALGLLKVELKCISSPPFGFPPKILEAKIIAINVGGQLMGVL